MSTAARFQERPRERGTIMVDFFIAVALFMIVLGAFFQLTAIKVRALGEAERRMRALASAQSRIAEVRSGSMIEPAGGDGIIRFDAPAGARGELTVKPRPDGLRDVVVVVRWREPNRGGAEEVQLATVVTAP